MSFQHEYPYGDVHELNLDWIIQTMQEFINSEREAGNTPTVSSVRSFFTHKYPYGDIHELNLDWVIQTALRMEEIGDSVEGDIGELQTRMTTAEGNISTLDNTVSGLSDSIVEMGTEIENINDDVEELQTAVTQHTTQIEELDEKIDEQVVANPAGAATDTLNKIEIAGKVYDVEGSGGSEVEANPAGEPTDTLETIGIDGTIYEVGASVPVSKTATGNPIHIEDAAAAPIVSGEVVFEPIQDLHGYDKPWAGGNGKNKLPLNLAYMKSINTTGTWSDNVYTISGLTFTVNLGSDGNGQSITVKGVPSATVMFVLALFDGATAIYILNGCPSGGSSETYSLTPNGSNSDYGEGILIPSDSNWNKYVSIYIHSGVTIPASGYTFYPMLRLATESDATFEPYSNICPIEGYTDCELEVTDDDTSPTVTQTYTIDLDGTRYGGTVDLVSGVMKVDKVNVDLGDLTWNLTGVRFYTAFTPSNPLYPYAPYGDSDYVADAICSQYFITSRNDIINYDGAFSIHHSGTSNNTVYLSVTDSRFTDVQSFTTAMSGVQACFKIGNPFTVQLTPEQIRTLEGTNNISTNMMNMLLEYITGSYQPLVELIERSAGHHYSTQERVIGTWFGKPLYEKVFSVTLPTFTYNQWTVIDSAELSNVSEMPECLALKDTRTQSELPSTFAVIGALNNNNKLQVMNLRNADYGSNIPARVIVRYTKTTD